MQCDGQGLLWWFDELDRFHCFSMFFMMIINGDYRSCSVHAWRGSLHGRQLLPQHRWVSLGFLPSAHFYRFARSRNRCAAGMTGAQSKHSGSTIATLVPKRSLQGVSRHQLWPSGRSAGINYWFADQGRLRLGDLGGCCWHLLTMRQTWRTTSIGLVEAADLVERVLPSISWQTTMWGPWRLPAGKKCPSRNIQVQGMIWLLKCTHSDACARVFQSYDWDILGHSWTFYHIWTSGVNFTFMFQLVSFPTFPDAIITITRHMFRHFRVRLGIWKMGTTEATTGRVQPQQGNRVGMGPGNHCIDHHKTTARPRMSSSHKCSMDLCNYNFISFYDQVKCQISQMAVHFLQQPSSMFVKIQLD